MNKKHSIALSASLSLVLCQPVIADDGRVTGYLKNSSGSVITSGSGDCVRTQIKDSTELLEDCGYELVVEKAAVVESGPEGATVTIGAVAGVVKDDKLVALAGAMVEQVTINNVEFAFDSAELSPAYRQELDLASDALKPHRAMLRQGLAVLNVVGYTDSRGSDVYNQQLSERRAQAVADYLIQQDSTRAAFIQVIGRGESDPIATNDTSDGRRQNRRVVLEIIGK